ncbi:hypothetical protein BJ165DRAFT_566933 [Panaeolus papilionaceus]|nr:hypothetical protein BJ165DRAFT_566933 [Panaeolus papilionaceus]
MMKEFSWHKRALIQEANQTPLSSSEFLKSFLDKAPLLALIKELRSGALFLPNFSKIVAGLKVPIFIISIQDVPQMVIWNNGIVSPYWDSIDEGLVPHPVSSPHNADKAVFPRIRNSQQWVSRIFEKTAWRILRCVNHVRNRRMNTYQLGRL